MAKKTMPPAMVKKGKKGAPKGNPFAKKGKMPMKGMPPKGMPMKGM